MKRLVYEEEGASAVEYSMIIGLVALVAFVALYKLGHILFYALYKIFWNYIWW